MADASAAPAQAVEKTRCYICNIKVKDDDKAKSKKHIEMDLIPEELSNALINSGLWTQEECDEAWIDACFLCSEATSHYFSNLERARYLACPQTLKAALKQIGWIEFRLRKGENRKYQLTVPKLDTVDWDTEECRKYKERWLTTDTVDEPEVEAEAVAHEDPAPQGDQDQDEAAAAAAAAATNNEADEDQEDDPMSDAGASRASTPAVEEDEDELDDEVNEIPDSEGESERELGSEDEDEDDEDEAGDENEDGNEDSNASEGGDGDDDEDDAEGEHQNQNPNPNPQLNQQQLQAQAQNQDQVPNPNVAHQEAALPLPHDHNANQGHEQLHEPGIPNGAGARGNALGGEGMEGEGNANGADGADGAVGRPLSHKSLAKIMLKIDENHDRREQRRDTRMTELLNARISTVEERFKLADERHTTTTRSVERLEASCRTLEPDKRALQDRLQACEASSSALKRDHEQVRDEQANISRALRADVIDVQARIEDLETEMEVAKRQRALIKRLQDRIEALEEANEDQPRKRRKLDKGKQKALFAPESSDTEASRQQSEELPEPSDYETSRQPSEEIPEPSDLPVKRKTPQYASAKAPVLNSAFSSAHINQTVNTPPAPLRQLARRTGALASGSGARRLIAVEIPVPARPTANTSAVQPRQAAPAPVLPAVITTPLARPLDEVDELMSPVADLVSSTAKDMLVESCPIGGAAAGSSRLDSVLSRDASGEDETQASTSVKKLGNIATTSRPYSFRSSTNLTSPAKRTATNMANGNSAYSSKAAPSSSAALQDDSIPVIDLSGPVNRSYPNQAALLAAQSKPALRSRQSLPTAVARNYPARGAGAAVLRSSTLAAEMSASSAELLSLFEASQARSQDPPSTSQNYLQLRNRVIQPPAEQNHTSAGSQTESSSSQVDEDGVKPKIECATEDNAESMFSADAKQKGKMPAIQGRARD